MLSTKLVFRLLNTDGTLLGWVAHDAAVRGDGHLRAASDVAVPIEAAGAPAILSVHWADVNVETRMPTRLEVAAVEPGQNLRLYSAGEVILTIGVPPENLPPITVRSNVTVSVPPGSLGATGYA